MKTLKEIKLEKLQYLKNHGDVRVSASELEAKAGQLARIAYRILKDAEAARRAERKAYKDAAAPFAAAMGMTPEDKNLFIC